MASFQETLLELESKSTTSCDLYKIMTRFRNTVQNRHNDNFFGMKVKLAMRKNYLPELSLRKFTSECMIMYSRAIAYIQKWYDFERSPYRALQSLGLSTEDRPPSLDDVLDVWASLRSDSPPDNLLDEVSALSTVFSSLEGSTADKWKAFFCEGDNSKLVKTCPACAINSRFQCKHRMRLQCDG
jgi:hypothetical protein